MQNTSTTTNQDVQRPRALASEFRDLIDEVGPTATERPSGRLERRKIGGLRQVADEGADDGNKILISEYALGRGGRGSVIQNLVPTVEVTESGGRGDLRRQLYLDELSSGADFSYRGHGARFESVPVSHLIS